MGISSPINLGLPAQPLTDEPKLFRELVPVYNAIKVLQQVLTDAGITTSGNAYSFPYARLDAANVFATGVQQMQYTLQVTGLLAPTAGAGVEVAYDTVGDSGAIIAARRDVGFVGYKPLAINATALSLQTSSGNLNAYPCLNLLFGGTANFLQAANANAGSSPQIGVAGADANINLSLNAKGTGYILFNTLAVGLKTLQIGGKQDPLTGVGTEIFWDGATGGIIVYDRVGAAYKPLIIASSTLNLFSDLVYLGKPGMANDIQWGKAIVALGGGAVPAFGTIGGAGPAGAGQNGWIRMLDSAGIPCWVPVWK